jgi:hypothetical protein
VDDIKEWISLVDDRQMNAHFTFCRLTYSSFFSFPGVSTNVNARFSTRVHQQMPEEMLSSTQVEIRAISDKWASIRHLSREELVESNIEPEWLAAYDKFHTEYTADMERMNEICERLQKTIGQPKIAKKTLGQRRRDAWAIKSERIRIREANLAKKTKKTVEAPVEEIA